ncbi:MAG: hypothetical protein ACYDAG_14220, partial [Chloroflexota bacterium]
MSGLRKYFVSRQSYWGVEPEDANVVEIAADGLDYANPDMLVSKYPSLGEGQEFVNPALAAEAAVAVAQAWRTAEPGLTIQVAHGCSGGDTMPFEVDTDEAVLAWGKALALKLPACDRCG